MDRKGFTMVEMLICLIGAMVVISATIAVYNKWNNSFNEHEDIGEYISSESTAYLQLQAAVLRSSTLALVDNICSLGDGNTIKIDGDSILLNDTVVLETTLDKSMSLDGNRLIVGVGDKQWVFRRIRTVT